MLVLLTRDPLRDVKYAQRDGLFTQGNPDDLFGDGGFGKEFAQSGGGGGGVGGRGPSPNASSSAVGLRNGSDHAGAGTDSDDDPPPGPRAPYKVRESGMDRRARKRAVNRKKKRRGKKLSQAPPHAALALGTEKEPMGPEAVQFVPFPLPCVVDLIQGSREIWAHCVLDPNSVLTGDDVLRLGEHESADYPVAPRVDDVVRRRRPHPPPEELRPDILESIRVAEREAADAAAAEAASRMTGPGSELAQLAALAKRNASSLSERQRQRLAHAQEAADAALAAAALLRPTLAKCEVYWSPFFFSVRIVFFFFF